MGTFNVTAQSGAHGDFETSQPAVIPDSPPATKVMVAGKTFATRSTVSWGYVSGVSPQQLIIGTRPSYANAIIAAANGGYTTFEYESVDPTNQVIVESFRKIAVITKEPGSDSRHEAIRLVDERWAWPRISVTRAYNIVRKISDKFTPGDTGGGGNTVVPNQGQGTPGAAVPRAIQPLVTDFPKYFTEWSLKQVDGGNLKPWTALEIVVDILVSDLGYSEKDIDITRATRSKYVPMNQIIVAEQAPGVLARYLDSSDNDLYIDKDGKIVIYSTVTPMRVGDFTKWAGKTLDALISGAMLAQDRRATRPAFVRNTFEIEEEIILHAREDAGLTDRTELPATTEEEAERQIANRVIAMENVTRTVIDRQVGSLARGSIVTIEEALSAFGTKYGSGPISLETYRKNYGQVGFQGAIQGIIGAAAGGAAANVTFDKPALRAWSAIQNDYRRLFRVPPRIASRFKDLQPLMVSVLNFETGLRSPSYVFSEITWMGVKFQSRIATPRDVAVPLNSFEDEKYTSTSILASVEDVNLGLIRVHPQTDIRHPDVVSDVMMGTSRDAAFNLDGFAEGETPTGPQAMTPNHGLATPWEVDIVMSAIWLTPNNRTRLYNIDIETPKEVGPNNGLFTQTHLSVDTARFRLSDIYSRYNPEDVGPEFVNADFLQAVAAQEAYRIYISHVDQVIGTVTVGLSKDALALRPHASVRNIKHSISGKGAARVSFNATRLTNGPNIQNRLPENVLRALYRQVSYGSAPQGSR